jgi:hypothetical protein
LLLQLYRVQQIGKSIQLQMAGVITTTKGQNNQAGKNQQNS